MLHRKGHGILGNAVDYYVAGLPGCLFAVFLLSFCCPTARTSLYEKITTKEKDKNITIDLTRDASILAYKLSIWPSSSPIDECRTD